MKEELEKCVEGGRGEVYIYGGKEEEIQNFLALPSYS